MLQNKKRMKSIPAIEDDIIDNDNIINDDDNKSSDNNHNSDDDTDKDDDDDIVEKDVNKGNDGLADMMNRILHQNIGSKINPVLAKRKTSLMKEIETDNKDNNILKKLKKDNKIDRNKQMVIPDATTIDFERQLRKLATRGVVALFNAIAKAKRDEDPNNNNSNNNNDDDKKNGRKTSKNNKDNTKTTTYTNSDNNDLKKNKTSSNNIDNNSTNSNKWAAVKDDYMIGSNLSVKNWDKSVESDSDEE